MNTTSLFAHRLTNTLCAFLVGMFIFQFVYAEEFRIALIIGNNVYSQLESDKQLTNPVNDASGMRDTLDALGFNILYLSNVTKETMESAFEAFGEEIEKLNPAQNDVTALFYYAGHGAQVGGQNYLLSVDYKPNLQKLSKEIDKVGNITRIDANTNTYILSIDEEKVDKLFDITEPSELYKEIREVGNIDLDNKIKNTYILHIKQDKVSESGIIPLSKLFKYINKANQNKTTNIFIIDACRNDPSIDVIAFNTRGLKMQWPSSSPTITNTNSEQQPSNSIFAYSTARGKVAADGEESGNNSKYTKYLLNIMSKSKMPITEIFQQVSNLMVNDASVYQQPWQYSSLVKNFYFKQREVKPPLIW